MEDVDTLFDGDGAAAAGAAAHGLPAGLEGAAAPPAPPPAALRTVPMQDADFDLFEEHEEVEDPSFCFWCRYAQSKQELAGSGRVARLVTYHNENYAHVHPFTYAAEMQRLYNLHVRDFMVRPAGKRQERYRGPAWGGRSIYEHTLTHVISPATQRERAARTFATVLRTLEENAIFQRDELGKPGVDLRSVDAYIKTWRELKPVLKDVEGARNGNLFSVQ